MKKQIIFYFSLFSFNLLAAQKIPLDHSVYDGWQSIGERVMSHDGKWVVYTICPQEGDTTLVIQQADNSYKKEIERGFNAAITEDNRFVIFRIKPYQEQLKEARKKKTKTEDMPKDTLGIFEFGSDSVSRIPDVLNYRLPEKGSGWVAFRKIKSKDSPTGTDAGELVLRKLSTKQELLFPMITTYLFDKRGTKLLLEASRNAKDSTGLNYVILYDLLKEKTDTISRGGNDFKNYVFDETGTQLAFVAERDAEPKGLQKFYKLWYYKNGLDSAMMLVDKNSVGMKLGMSIGEYGSPGFSKNGQRLFFGSAPIQPIKDTTQNEADQVKIDIWHYNDDYLQTQQLVQLNSELRRTYLSVYDLSRNTITNLGSPDIPQIMQTNESDGDIFVGVTDTGKRIESQWLGTTRKDIYAISVQDGSAKQVKKNLHGFIYPSPTGKYILWYDRAARHYFLWDGITARNISAAITVPLWNEEFDTPDNPTPYGMMGWEEGDEAVFVYDKYGVWKLSTAKGVAPKLVLNGRAAKKIYRYIRTDPEERFISKGQKLVFSTFYEQTKKAGYWKAVYDRDKNAFTALTPISQDADVQVGRLIRSTNGKAFTYTLETFVQAPDLYSFSETQPGTWKGQKLSSINPQQKNYLWGTAELFSWTTAAGKRSTGILYKPENFDPAKKYPVIIYFYEQLSDNLHNYIDPAPTRSSINTSFFVSNGYVVFHPDIHYGTGHPGKDAYDYVVSGARALAARYKWIDAARMGIQGHSWGGYQVAYIITKTNMFKASWSGAPVVNMTSAYGGIRYGSGVNRQFQYEKTQSRIGKNLWEALPQYMESSPLFTLNKVNTPVVILHNDRDDAVPYTQGLEMFTALRRLNKKVWLINYNGEPHGVNQRKNRKDLAIRFEQYFDWLLKDKPPAKWLSEGVPAVRKGFDLGLD